MNAYEILFIIKTDFTESQREKTTTKLQESITSKKGEILEFKELGLKDFAMELKKQTQGYYYQCRFKANNEQLAVLENHLKVTEDIFRHIIVTLDSVLTSEELEKVLK